MTSSEVDAGIRTVRHLTVYFRELTKSAKEIAKTIQPVERGYFSATEDERVQACLVSYWHTRCAALELICDWRRTQPEKEPDRSLYFILGFCTSLLLVDAARLLREETESRPVVRRKLNQPVPSCGIPGGCYDAVQRSLMSARNAWRLYHASVFCREHRDQLSDIARAHNAEDIVATIESLWDKVDVSFQEFASYSLRTRSEQMLRRMGRTFMMRAIYGIQKLGSELVADVYVRHGHRPAIPSAIIRELADCVEPGDVFVVRKEFALTNYFLPGYWPHAALYLGTPDALELLGVTKSEACRSRWPQILASSRDSGHCVLEAMKDGVRVRSWLSPLASDSLVLLRPRLSRPHIVEALGRVLVHEGKDYDFDFDFGRSDRLVCTEVVYRAYDEIGDMRFDMRRRAGRPTISGGDLVRMAVDGEHWEPVAAYVPAQEAVLKTDREARPSIELVLAHAN